VLCLDASRLARNGRDWHYLLELCGLVDARVIDLDCVYNPCRPNDRLLLGMKGSISEFGEKTATAQRRGDYLRRA
jgi:DNA invertase Pin-like site-specific DNA recombinase